MPKRVLQGVVVSNKGEQTITVLVSRRVNHPVYRKVITKSKKYTAHDPSNAVQEGANVTIVEHAPISKTKRWIVAEG
jgi:small subunit ribosomal protein S17